MSYYPNDGQGYNQQNINKSLSQPTYGGGGYGGNKGTSLKLSSTSKDFHPTSNASQAFFGVQNQNNMNPNQQSYYQQPGYQNMQVNKPQSQPQQQVHQMGMNINQYPNQIYQQPQQTIQQNTYMPQPGGFVNVNVPYGYQNPNTFPTSNISGPSSLNTSISTDYSEMNGSDFDKVIEHIANLKYPEKREEALQELSKKRESFPKLAVYLWHSVGTLAILLQEIVAIYPVLSPQTLSQTVSCKVCNVLGLLQCLALHPDTRGLFLNAHIPLFLYPFLNTTSKSKPFENLRVTSLGVIGALVKGDDSDAITFLMQTEIIPLCLRIMKRGQELSRTVATFIVQKILLDDNGLNYICHTAERFFAVCTVLNHMVTDIVANSKDDQRLLRHVIRCYLRLTDNPKGKEALKKNLPDPLRDEDSKLITDETVKKTHTQLLQTLELVSDKYSKN